VVAWTSVRAVRISALVAVIGALGIASALASTTTTTTMRSWNSPRYGQIVAGPAKYTLYFWCYGTSSYCNKPTSSRKWPPMLVHGRLTASPHSGLNPRKLGKHRLHNGSYQVTYYGQPLYLYSGDRKTCEANGEGKLVNNGVFMVVTTSGRAEPTPCYPGDPPGTCPPVCGK
jgi:predicted lipoprotein with Yx(FWY)xxD motif